MSDAPAFTAYPLDRADRLRGDEAALAALRTSPDARIVLFWKLRPLVRETDGRLAPAAVAGDQFEHGRYQELFLGLGADDRPMFAAALDGEAEPAPPVAGARFMELREAAALLEPGDGSILAAARSTLAWHEAHGFCAKCGGKSRSVHGGWRRLCTVCAAEHYPRSDPVVIMLIVRGEAILLGRQPTWPERFYSCLAGFVEPGETIEAAARREAREEAGVVLGEVDYLMSQPWPFPSSFMLGVKAEALTDEIVVDQSEIADARWFSRADVEAIMAGTHPAVRRPSEVAVAHHLIRWWLEKGAGS